MAETKLKKEEIDYGVEQIIKYLAGHRKTDRLFILHRVLEAEYYEAATKVCEQVNQWKEGLITNSEMLTKVQGIIIHAGI